MELSKLFDTEITDIKEFVAQLPEQKGLQLKPNGTHLWFSFIDNTLEDSVIRIYEYWVTTVNKPLARLTPKRQIKIRARLQDGWTEEQLKMSIDGITLSDWHMGINPNRTTYNDILFLFKDHETVEKFIELHERHQTNKYRVKRKPRTIWDALNEE